MGGRHRHGADDLTSRERLNLIIWNNSSSYRRSAEFREEQKAYLQESGPPDATCLSFTHDRDYGVFKDYTDNNSSHAGRGWCPPEAAVYEGFVPEASKPSRLQKSVDVSCTVM